jgi:hypothetical protein
MGYCTINVSGSPPLLSYWLLLQNRLFWKKRIVYRMTDFYPEVALAAGKARWLAWAKPAFKALRRTAHQIELLGYDQAARLSDDAALAPRITIWRDSSPIENWGAVEARERPFKAPYRILLYSGNLGVAHETDTICEAYRRHVRQGSDRVRLWINGTGVRIAQVQRFCETHGLPLAVSPPAPLGELAGVLKAADAHLITLEAPFWGYVFPSKTYACLEAGQPILYIGPVESDVHRLCTQFAGTYWHVNPGDVEACFAKLEALGSLDRTTARMPRRIDFGTRPPLKEAS